MKKYVFLVSVIMMLIPIAASGQISLKKVLERTKEKTDRKIENRIENKLDNAVDKTLDDVEDSASGKSGTAKNSTGNSASRKESASSEENSSGLYPANGATEVPVNVTLKWETPQYDDGFKAVLYEVYVGEKGDFGNNLAGTSRENEFSCKDLKTNTTYEWSVKASDGKRYMPGPGGTFTTGKAVAAPMNVQWNKFDFVPGDKVIFEDGPDPMEENGEFPSRWDLVEGQVEIASVNGETVMMFLDGGKIIPYLKNRDQDYLPDVFTIEFDFYTPKGGNRIKFFLSDQKNQTHMGNAQEFDVTPIRVDTPDGNYVEHSQRDYSYCENGCWTHVSIAYTKGKLKVYLDDTRLVNIPHYELNPTGFTFYPYFADAADNEVFYAKNFRIAEGGVKYYDRVMTEGKIICNGIRFDVNKATLKAESMGPINNIFELMQKQPDLKFSVEGHTDSDGDETANQKLSEERAKTVEEQLIAMGISAERLSSKGFGESKPIDNNSTAEGKANNRRVEFVKF